MTRSAAPRSPGAFLADPAVRALLWQALLVVAIVALAAMAASNLSRNMQTAKISRGFGFLWAPADFDLSWSILPFHAGQTYAAALAAGFVNTLLAAAVGIVLATVVGVIVGLARLSGNALASGAANVWIEVLRNTPLLLQLLVWYNLVLKPLPGPRQSLDLGAGVLLNNRGLYAPAPAGGPGWHALLTGLLLAVAVVAAAMAWRRFSRARTGAAPGFLRLAPLALVLFPAIGVWWVGGGLPVSTPALGGFNVVGGMTAPPELVALVLGLGLYTSAFIAEIVRSGVQSTPRGQIEAGRALGLSERQILRLIVAPLALRVIIPPLTGQYLNLTKNSSLAVAIGYPDLVSVGFGPVLQNSGQALEVITLIMVVYLVLSLITSALMNLWNARMALVER